MSRRIIGNLSLPVNSALDPFLRVKLSGGYLVAAGADDPEVGVLEENVIGPPQQTMAAVIPLCDPSARDGVAADSIVQYALVYAAASGQLTDTTGTAAELRGMALSAASAGGSHFQYLPFLQSAATTGLASALADGEIFVGNGSNLATAVAVTGDVTITDSGVTAIGANKVVTAKILDANVTTAKLAAGAGTLPKLSFTGLKVLVQAGVASAGAVTLTGAAVGDRVVAVFGTLTAGGPLLAAIVGTDFESAISIINEVQQLVATLDSDTFVFVLAPAEA